MKPLFSKIDAKNYTVTLDGVKIGTVWKGMNGCWQGYDRNDNQVTHYEPTKEKAAASLIKAVKA